MQIKTSLKKKLKLIKQPKESITLTENQIKNIILEKNHIPIAIINPKNKIHTTYVYKSTSKNFIFYVCNNRKDCKGKGKIDIKDRIFYITEDCNTEIEHKNIEYKDFIELNKKNDLKNIDFKKIINSKILCRISNN